MSVHGTLPSQLEQAGAIINEQVVAVGGCNTTGVLNNSCAQGNSFVINAANGNSISPAPCTVPRVNAVVAPNLNGFSTSFASQMFVMLGTYNQTLWQDGDGLEHGEVVSQFSRILASTFSHNIRLFWTLEQEPGLAGSLLEILIRYRLIHPLETAQLLFHGPKL